MAEQGGPPTKRRKLNLTEEITVLVGRYEQRFTVAKTFLMRTSDFFKACCNGEWKESKERTVKLPEMRPASFEIYLQWLYTDEVVASDYDLPPLAKASEILRQEAAIVLAWELLHLAVLGDVLGDVTFRNAVVDELLRMCDYTRFNPGPDFAKAVYAELPAKSKLRILLVDIYVLNVSDDFILQSRGDLPFDFIFDMMMSLRQAESKKSEVKPGYASRCLYHEHGHGKTKCA